MKQREIIVEHKYIDGKYEHCFDDENYNLLELERKVFLNENKKLQERIDKAIEYIEQGIWSNGIDEEKQYSLHIPTLLEILKGE